MRTKNVKAISRLVPLALGTALFAGCVAEIGTGVDGLPGDVDGPARYGQGGTSDDDNVDGDTRLPGTPGAPSVPTSPIPVPTSRFCANTGRVYRGIGGRVLVSTRVDKAGTEDRRRVKPYSALQTEFPRVLGNSPTTLAAAAATYGAPADRWYEEPTASAVTLFTTFRIAFQGCLTLTANGTEYSAAPTVASAGPICRTLAKKFWSREPEANEVEACVKVAATDTASETNARRRWAYACATLLSTSGFLSY